MPYNLKQSIEYYSQNVDNLISDDNLKEKLLKYKEYIEATKSESTTITYLIGIVNFLRFCDENNKKDYFTNDNIRDYVIYLSKKYSTKTIYSYISFVMSVCKYLELNIKFPELPKQEQRLKRSLSDEQVKKYLHFVKENIYDPYRTAFMILPYCGLRIGELTSLKPSDVIIEELPEGFGIWISFIVRAGKNKKERYAPLLKDGINIFKEYAKNYFKKNAQYLFYTKDNKKLNIRYIYKLMDIISKNLGFKVHPHIFRSTFATKLSSMGVNTLTIMQILGHTSASTTLIYDKPTLSNLIQRIENIKYV